MLKEEASAKFNIENYLPWPFSLSGRPYGRSVEKRRFLKF
jgi:hypothetical protein